VVDNAKKGKKEIVMFKVYFEKDYDSFEWGYLYVVMEKMGFPSKRRQWIMECVNTTIMLVLVNISPIEEFQMGRGLKQGDHSHYSFNS